MSSGPFESIRASAAPVDLGASSSRRILWASGSSTIDRSVRAIVSAALLVVLAGLAALAVVLTVITVAVASPWWIYRLASAPAGNRSPRAARSPSRSRAEARRRPGVTAPSGG